MSTPSPDGHNGASGNPGKDVEQGIKLKEELMTSGAIDSKAALLDTSCPLDPEKSESWISSQDEIVDLQHDNEVDLSNAHIDDNLVTGSHSDKDSVVALDGKAGLGRKVSDFMPFNVKDSR